MHVACISLIWISYLMSVHVESSWGYAWLSRVFVLFCAAVLQFSQVFELSEHFWVGESLSAQELWGFGSHPRERCSRSLSTFVAQNGHSTPGVEMQVLSFPLCHSFPPCTASMQLWCGQEYGHEVLRKLEYFAIWNSYEVYEVNQMLLGEI